MIRAPFRIGVASAVLANLAITASAKSLPTTFDGLLDTGIATSIAEREQWEIQFPAYGFDPVTLLETGLFDMQLWAEIDGKMVMSGDSITAEAELIGVYDFTSRTFTWGWATDDYPTPELTAATREDRPAFGSAAANITSVIGDLVYETDVRVQMGRPLDRIIFFGLTNAPKQEGGS